MKRCTGRPRCSVSFHDFKNEISIPYSRILRQSVVVLIPSSFAASARLNARPPEPARSSHAGCFGQPLRRKGPGRRLKFRQYLTQRLHGNGAPVTDNAKPFDQIFKLSHISFPWVLTKKSHALLWYFNRRKGKLLGFFSNQSPYKQRDVVRPFAQRRDHQPQHIQTIKRDPAGIFRPRRPFADCDASPR